MAWQNTQNTKQLIEFRHPSGHSVEAHYGGQGHYHIKVNGKHHRFVSEDRLVPTLHETMAGISQDAPKGEEVFNTIYHPHPFKKALPPKLAYRFQKWLKSFKHHALDAPQRKKPLLQLQRSELEKSFKITDMGETVQLDFAPNIDPKIKKMAMDWAKRKGLTAIESSLNKSTKSVERIVFKKA